MNEETKYLKSIANTVKLLTTITIIAVFIGYASMYVQFTTMNKIHKVKIVEKTIDSVHVENAVTVITHPKYPIGVNVKRLAGYRVAVYTAGRDDEGVTTVSMGTQVTGINSKDD